MCVCVCVGGWVGGWVLHSFLKHHLPSLEQNFRGHIFRCATERRRFAITIHIFLTQSKVGELDEPHSVDENIFRLQVPVDYVVRVEVV